MQVSNNNQAKRYTSNSKKQNQPAFEEIQGAAFFLGKLNKNHNREQIYTALRSLAKCCNFYIRKLDMPYGNKYTKKGNLGYCFVHCKSKEEADRIVDMHYVKLGSQKCEVKAYGGRDIGSSAPSQTSSGYATPSYTQTPLSVVEADIAEILNRKFSVKAQDICSWTEECDDPLDYYTKCTDYIFNDAEVDSLIDEDTTMDKECPKELTPESVNSYIQQHLLTASSHGKALEFLQSYFEIYDDIEKKVQTMTEAQINELASQHSSLMAITY
jgi:hypothetical protein